MSSEPAVLTDLRDGVLTLTMNRPDNRNALSTELVNALLASIEAAIADPTAQAIVLTGTGSTFCAGADLKERKTVSAGAQAGGPPAFVRIFDAIEASPKPVVGKIQGHALAGGLGLACACDLSIAADTASFGFTEVRLGVAAAIISVVCLPKMNRADAMELFLLGERVTAARAQEAGLINRVVPAADLDAATEEIMAKIRLGGPNALRVSKQLVVSPPDFANRAKAFAEMAELSATMFAAPEGIEGMTAFAQKRPPAWTISDASPTG